MTATTLGRSIGKQIALHNIPGGTNFLSSAFASSKVALLKEIQQKYFQNGDDYDGTDIDQNDVLKAIQYARSKKQTKVERTATKGGLQVAGFVVGVATGATLGSVIPVAGTVAGGLAGGFGIGAVIGGGVTAVDQMKRKTKGLYKYLRGTRRKHRLQAAGTLLHHYALSGNDPKSAASLEALIVILGDEFDAVVAMGAAKAQERVADRLTSN